MVAYLGLDVNGMIGAILQVAVLIVIPFTILGQVLARTGGADFFSDIAMAAMGRFRGGAAKIAVVGSALFGMISGSAVSNVLAVGIVTIPTMIKVGLLALQGGRDRVGRLDRRAIDAAGDGRRRLHHGGVPAGARTARSASPPPSLPFLYYACLFIHVDLDAAKHKIGAARIADAPAARRSVRSRAGTSWCRSSSSSSR